MVYKALAAIFSGCSHKSSILLCVHETNAKTIYSYRLGCRGGSGGLAGYALFATPNTSSNAATQAATSSSSSVTDTTVSQNETTSTTTSSGATGSYKDGTYTASTSYMVPHSGHKTVSRLLLPLLGTITAVTVNNNYSDHESGMYVSDLNRPFYRRSRASHWLTSLLAVWVVRV